MKHIYIIRHGQTDFNQKGIVQGSGVNAPLNDLGERQAAAFHEHFRDVPFDKVYTSKLIRTHQTVKEFIAVKPHEEYAGLNEISWGIFEGQEINAKDKTVFSELIAQWKKGQLDLSLEKGESPIDVANRQKRFVPNLLNRPDEENVLICMHGRAMRVFLCVLLGLPLTEMDRFPHGNLCLYQLQMDTQGKMEIVKANYTDHLLNL